MQQLNLETIAESDRGEEKGAWIFMRCVSALSVNNSSSPDCCGERKRGKEKERKTKNCCRVTFKCQLWRNKTRGGGGGMRSLRSDSTTLNKLKKTRVIVGGKKIKKKVDSLLLNMKWCHRWLQNKSTHNPLVLLIDAHWYIQYQLTHNDLVIVTPEPRVSQSAQVMRRIRHPASTILHTYNEFLIKTKSSAEQHMGPTDAALIPLGFFFFFFVQQRATQRPSSPGLGAVRSVTNTSPSSPTKNNGPSLRSRRPQRLQGRNEVRSAVRLGWTTDLILKREAPAWEHDSPRGFILQRSAGNPSQGFCWWNFQWIWNVSTDKEKASRASSSLGRRQRQTWGD